MSDQTISQINANNPVNASDGLVFVVVSGKSNGGIDLSKIRQFIRKNGDEIHTKLLRDKSDNPVIYLVNGNFGVNTNNPVAPFTSVGPNGAGEGMPSVGASIAGLFVNNGVASSNCNFAIVGATDGFSQLVFGDKDSIVRTILKHNNNTDDFSIQLNGSFTDCMTFLASNGYVGINETNPQAKLHIVGPAGDGQGLPSLSSGTSLIIQNNQSASDDARVVICAGNAGVSTIDFADSGSNIAGLIYYDHNTGILRFYNGGERLLITNDGKLGTGGEVAPDVDPGGITLNHGSNDGNAQTIKNTDIAHPFTDFDETDTYTKINKLSAATGGAVFRGYSDSAQSGVDLQGYWGSNTGDTTNTTSSIGAVRITGTKSNGGTNRSSLSATENVITFLNTVTTIGILKGNGDLNLGGTVGAISDKRVKENIKDSESQTANIMLVRIVDYDRIIQESEEIEVKDEKGNVLYIEKEIKYEVQNKNGKIELKKEIKKYPKTEIITKDTGKRERGRGVIAQELLETHPEYVTGTENEDDLLNVQYMKFIPDLIKMNQEQQKIIEELKARIEVLEAK